jgi:predicted MPP superfamily phosphohydrolase
MSDEFVILHLSDAHIGNPKFDLDSLSVLRPLLEDLRSFSQERQLMPNLIIFSGDLAYGELPTSALTKQYERALSWLNEVFEALATTFVETPLLLVPGNHDLNQFLVDDAQIDWVLGLRGEAGERVLYEAMQEHGTLWHRMLERQQEWVQFVNSIPSQNWNFDPQLNMTTGVISHSNIKIGIAGLNSSWASTPSPRFQQIKGNLWLGKYQIQRALDEVKDATFKIAVSHHPLSWLNEAEEPWMTGRVESSFNMFMHGHDHSQWFRESPKHLIIEAGACYQGSTKSNAYSWTKVDFENETVQIHLRTYVDQGSGGWGPFYLPGKTDETGTASVLFPGSLEKTGRAASTPTETSIPLSASRVDGAALRNVHDYINLLQDRFGFRWEPSSFGRARQSPLIYWPVRLRSPTPIHAVQAFAAAGLQRYGCEIVLCLDDFGTQDYAVDEFLKPIHHWFSRAGGEKSRLVTEVCSKLLDTDDARHIWLQVQRWLGFTTYKLDKVLKVSKLLSADGRTSIPLQSLRELRPRRLLTPAVVWTCLVMLHHRDQSRQIATLAGYDERPLWQAWRDLPGETTAEVGHLYVPELTQRDPEHGEKAVHMSETPLAWVSREDIREALDAELAVSDQPTNWLHPSRLIPWCFRECVLLPMYLTEGHGELDFDGTVISSVDQLDGIDPDRVVAVLVEALNRWLL